MIESERYDRQIMLFGEDSQRRLSSSKVLVAGAGGLASPASVYLAIAGVGKIVIADGDHVSLSNLNRQFLHDKKRMGMNKALSAKETLERLNENVDVFAVDEPVTEENAEELFDGCSLVVDCLDNFEARRILNRQAVNSGIPMIHGAVSGWDGQASTIIPGVSPCFECMFPKNPPGETVPIVGTTAGVIGSIQANEAVRILAGFEPALCGKLLIWDGRCSSSDIMPFFRDEKCPVCSGIKK
ncbi:MAG: HesA/MoeB/ThiF family protein [Methanomicrobium sp.]|nr:HesA/MoeB/ThiF family protein [Methanomicrobium sp.]MDD4299734.1 HesA/MoeB/ThiF family protein [Methanomicrobium sp.]